MAERKKIQEQRMKNFFFIEIREMKNKEQIDNKWNEVDDG